MRSIISKDEARMKLMTGIQKLADAVGSTLGPYGRTVTVWKGHGVPMTTKDGVSVSREVILPDPHEAAGAELVKAAARKTAEEAGDGTTTATILAAALVSNGMEAMTKDRLNILEVREEYEKGLSAALNFLTNLRRDLASEADLTHVTGISANDKLIGAVIGPALWKVGKSGLATVKQGTDPGIKVQDTEGYRFDKGWIANQFVADAARLRTVLDKCVIYATPRTLTSGAEVVQVFETAVKLGTKSLLMIVGNMESEALSTSILNRQRGMIDVVVVRAPSFGERRDEILGDIMVSVGGKVHGDDEVFAPETMVGMAEKVEVDRMGTVIFGGAGNATAIKERLESIQTLIDGTASEFDKEELKKRAEALNGRAVAFEVGGRSEIEALELFHRVEDAVLAGKAAMREGVLPGRGKALLETHKQLVAMYPHFGMALIAPVFTLLQNADLLEPVDMADYFDIEDPWAGKDFKDWNNPKPIDLYEAGVIDPLQVTMSALRNATSAAILVLSTDVLIVEEPEKKV